MKRQESASRLLQMLATGSNLTEIRAVTDADPRLISAAVDIQTRLDASAERERTFSALVESLKELSGTGSVESILFTIASRAKRLMLSEVAYFLTVDRLTGEARIRVSDGIMSDAFSQLVVDKGQGIAGLIVETRRPSWTSDYVNDHGYNHSSPVDAATLEEGLKAMVGVPVMKEGVVLGVLLAADRRAHEFRHHDVELLTQLADHAAIVFQNAEAQASDIGAYQKLEATLTELKSRESMTHRLVDFQDRLFGVLTNGDSLQSVAALTAGELGAPVAILDEHRSVLVFEGSQRTEQIDHFQLVEKLSVHGQLLGYIAADVHVDEPESSDKKETNLEAQILQRAAGTTSHIISRLRAEATKGHSNAGKMISDLLHDPGSERARILASATGTDFAVLNRVAAMTSPERHMEELVRAAQRYVEKHGGLVYEESDTMILWLIGGDTTDLARHIHMEVVRMTGGPVAVGVSDMDATPENLAGCITQARDTSRTLVALGRNNDCTTASAVSPIPAILGRLTPVEIDALVDQSLGVLLAYDEEHSTDLAQTLSAVYSAGLNVSRAADRLFIHVNTLHQRLARIDELTSESWKDGAVMLQRQLALIIHALKKDESHARSRRERNNPQ